MPLGAPREVREPGGRAAVLPDVLTGSRFVLGPLFAATFPVSPGLALAIAALAAATDFVDGRLARALGVGSRRGAALDVSADAAFVLIGLGVLARAGVLSVALPVAAAISLAALAREWRRPPGGLAATRDRPDRVGHAAGILNYGAVLAGAGVAAFDVPVPLHAASLGVALLNLLPILLRRRPVRAPG